jgi:ribosomal-protein-alanine N-acetyltransferase
MEAPSQDQTLGPASMIIRKMEAVDVPAIAAILVASPGAAQWLPQDFVQPAWARTEVWVAEENGEVAGIIAARNAGGEGEILNLAVAPARRRNGLGRRLVDTAIAAARAAGAERVYLEVRESNAEARAFYMKLGFAESGRRSAYYRDPVEDALVLSWR